jgi:hypothetical protein
MALIDRIHSFFERFGIKPAVADILIGAAVLFLFNLIVYGTADVAPLKLAVALFILGALGYSAPPAVGLKQADVTVLARATDPAAHSDARPSGRISNSAVASIDRIKARRHRQQHR